MTSITNKYRFKVYDKDFLDLSASLWLQNWIILNMNDHEVKATTVISKNSNRQWVCSSNTSLWERKFFFKGTVCWKNKREVVEARRIVEKTFAIPANPSCWEFFRIEWSDCLWDQERRAKVKVFEPVKFKCIENSCWEEFEFCLMSETPQMFSTKCQEIKCKMTKISWVSFLEKYSFYESKKVETFKWFEEVLDCKPFYDDTWCCIMNYKWNQDWNVRIEVKGSVDDFEVYNYTNGSRTKLCWNTTDLVIDNTWILTGSFQQVIEDWGMNVKWKRKKGNWMYLSPWMNCIAFSWCKYDPNVSICLQFYEAYV